MAAPETRLTPREPAGAEAVKASANMGCSRYCNPNDLADTN
jgi:hypothetical protein